MISHHQQAMRKMRQQERLTDRELRRRARQEQLMHFDAFLTRFHTQRPILFWCFSAAIAVVIFGSGLLISRLLSIGANP